MKKLDVKVEKKTAQEYNSEHFQEIGQKGGEAQSNTSQSQSDNNQSNSNNGSNDENKMSHEEAGHKGGEKTAQEYSSEHFQEIGRKGGETTSKENNDN